MTLFKIELRLREKFLQKRCRIRGYYGGSETTYRLGKPVKRAIAGQEFKRVVNIEVGGDPSGWNWYATFVFDDDSISTTFTRMSDVEVNEE